ncbi:hypothetical protein ARTHROSP310_38790 [Arthrobacter sp. AD-310]
MLKIISHPGIGNGNPLNPGILNLPPQSLSNNNLNPLRQLGSTCRISHNNLLEKIWDVRRRREGLLRTLSSMPRTKGGPTTMPESCGGAREWHRAYRSRAAKDRKILCRPA